MSLLPTINIALRGFAAFWSLITFAVAAAFLAEVNRAIGSVADSTLVGSAGAVVAAGVLGFLYFSATLFLIFVRPDTFLLSLIVDTTVVGILFLISLGGIAGESSFGSDFANCGRRLCDLGSGLLGVGWVYTLLLLGILVFQVVYTIIHFGSDYATWKVPFNEHISGGSGSYGGRQTRSTNSRAATV